MNRRDFGKLIGAAAVGVALERTLVGEQTQAAAAAQRAVSPAAASLYARAFVLDCNNAPPLEDSTILTPKDLAIAKESGVDVVKSSLGGINEDFENTVGELAAVHRIIERYPEHFLQVIEPADMDRAHREKKMGVIFSFESVEMLGDKIERIELFRNLGVRVMQLSYNKQSPFGSGVLAPGGLTELGRKAIAKMNEIGVALDLSHANPQTSMEAIAATENVPIMSHAGCAAVYQHPRNKSDELLKALVDKGGVVGIYMLPYLTAPPKQPTLDDYMAHMTHALRVCGEDHVGVGCDVGMQPFDESPKAMEEFHKEEEARIKAGVAAPGEDRPPYVVGLNSPRKMEIIADALLKRGYSSAAVEKVLGANWRRVFTAIWS